MFRQDDYLSTDEPCSSACYDPQKMTQSQIKKVRFSDYSESCLVPLSEYRSKKAYTRKQIKLFKKKAIRDALRVRFLLITALQKEIQSSTSTLEALKLALERGTIDEEYIIGIEHIINRYEDYSENRRKLKDRRKLKREAHTTSVLEVQRIMKEKLGGVQDANLATFASKLSAISVNEALVRASWSNVTSPRQTFDSQAKIDPCHEVQAAGLARTVEWAMGQVAQLISV